MNRSVSFSLLFINSLMLVVFGLFLILSPNDLLAKMSKYAIFDWEEFAFSEGAVAFYLTQLVRLLGLLLCCLGIAGFLILAFNWKGTPQKGFWWMLLPTHILPYSFLMLLAFYTTRFGVLEMLGAVILALSFMAWWRLKDFLND
jgi:hypothetical protein